MESENRRELALKELEKARKHFEKIFDILNREEETFELETYYGTIGCYFEDLKHEIEDMQLYNPEVEDPTEKWNRAMKKKEHMINYLDNAYDYLEKAQIKINELMEQEPESGVECNEYGEPEDNLDYDSDYFTLYEFSKQIEYIQENLKLYMQDLMKEEKKKIKEGEEKC